MFFSSTFTLQLLGFAVCALNYNLESGAGEALVYDSLKLLGREDGFMKVKGRQEFLIQSAAVVAFLLGGWLAVRDYALNFGLSALFAVSTIATGLFFQEPPIERDAPPRRQGMLRWILSATLAQTVSSLAVVRKRPRIAFFILFSELTFVFGTTSFFYLQNYWKGQGRTEWYIGVIFALQCAVSGVTGLLTPAIEKRLGERGILFSVPLLMAFCLWGIALSPLPALFFVMLGFLEGVLLVAVSDYINRLIPSAYRATILSYQSMVFSFFMILLFPTVGLIGERLGLQSGFLFMAGLATTGVCCFLVLLGIQGRRSG
jgi:MFS family permease